MCALRTIPPPSPHVGQTTYNESCSRVSEATYEQRAKVDKNASDVVFDGSYRCVPQSTEETRILQYLVPEYSYMM